MKGDRGVEPPANPNGKVERAKTLSLNGKDAIAEIAQQIGFANQAHLNVHVKRLLGITPKTIREQSKNR